MFSVTGIFQSETPRDLAINLGTTPREQSTVNIGITTTIELRTSSSRIDYVLSK